MVCLLLRHTSRNANQTVQVQKDFKIYLGILQLQTASTLENLKHKTEEGIMFFRCKKKEKRCEQSAVRQIATMNITRLFIITCTSVITTFTCILLI